jgi:hypothetical protein
VLIGRFFKDISLEIDRLDELKSIAEEETFGPQNVGKKPVSFVPDFRQ